MFRFLSVVVLAFVLVSPAWSQAKAEEDEKTAQELSR